MPMNGKKFDVVCIELVVVSGSIINLSDSLGTTITSEVK